MDCVMSHHHDCKTLRENIMRRQQQQAVGAVAGVAVGATANTPSLTRSTSDITTQSTNNNNYTPPPRPSSLSKHDSEPTITTKSQLQSQSKSSSSSLVAPPTSSLSSSSSTSSPIIRSKSYDFMFPWTSAQSNNSMTNPRSAAADPARGFLSFNANWRYDREQRRVIIGRDPSAE